MEIVEELGEIISCGCYALDTIGLACDLLLRSGTEEVDEIIAIMELIRTHARATATKMDNAEIAMRNAAGSEERSAN